ncbi:uncharacterized protein LOC133320015 [Danaus plexippus]|uniref:uncharacterized protein LOC133320015 n=1 Tax=Danaus plexippus TaxID=13037 RepID=UPI002AB20757|nr:uncharacterized protein LOC133320015 [Danaus plexippus]
MLFIGRVTYAADKAGKLSKKQFGFRPQTSTTAAVYAAIDSIKRSQIDKLLTVIKAAFDNAWWPALFHRLRHIGCPLNIYGLIHSYTQNRTVMLDHSGSRVSKTMSKGCIQGSTCGPHLWNIILDELLEIELPPGCRLQAFADDVLLVASAKTASDLQVNINSALHTITGWGKGVKLSFSPAKTQALAFSAKAKQILITMDSHTFHFQKSIKFLGVILDDKLNFREHINHIVIQPIITYAAGVWGHVADKKCVRKKLLSMQRAFALKAIRGFRTVSTSAALALALFTPLDLKVKEANRVEATRLTGSSPLLPAHITLESPTPPHLLLHPAHRHTYDSHTFWTQNEVQEFQSRAHPNTTHTFTDGNKLEDGTVGAAFVSYDRGRNPVSKKFKLHNSCTVFQAELLAILKACEWASSNQHTSTVIYSDSSAAILAIQNRSNTHPLVAKIHSTVHHTSGSIEFAWVKAHVGIVGNEAADTAAKRAAKLHKAPDYTQFPIAFIKHYTRSLHASVWQSRYESEPQGQHTKQHLPTIKHIIKLHSLAHNTFTLTQTLTGHAYTKQYLHRVKVTEDAVCPCDGTTVQSMGHVLEDCPRFIAPRSDHQIICSHAGVSPFNMASLLQDKEATISFIKFSEYIINHLKAFNNT